jgi:hypothetical protein
VTHNINIGFDESFDPNFTLLNASLEKTIFKKKNGFIKVSGYDILKQNQGLTRTFGTNTITDTRVNRLTRYFMLTFTYRLNRFSGQTTSGGQQQNMQRTERQMRF